jgi:hypothetical protein
MKGKAKTNNMISIIAALIPLALLLYVLSIGPALYVAGIAGLPLKPFIIFYAPVIWLHEHTILQAPLEKYREMWGWE